MKYLEYYNMLELFTEIVTKHNKFKRKPHPEGFIYLIEKYNLDKETTLVIGDRECDIAGGRSAGIKTCFYNSNNIALSEGADFKITSLVELHKIL